MPCVTLGYDVNAQTRKLVVNEEEAARVRAIFALYLDHRGLLPVVEELARRGWCNKQSRTRQGRVRGGRPFTKGSLHQLLTNVTYIGQVRYHQEVHPGEQPAIVDPETWQKVQALLAHNGQARAVALRSRSRALLQGLLYCRPCGCAMTPSHVRHGNRRYRYYVCSAAQRKGRHTCPSKSLSAAAIERYVLEQITSRQRGRLGYSLSLESSQQLRDLVARIDYDGTNRQVVITLKPKPPTQKERS